MLVQYVVLRADLWKDINWPLGSIVAQACHAATAALWESREEPSSQQYCSPAQLNHMHKVMNYTHCPLGRLEALTHELRGTACAVWNDEMTVVYIWLQACVKQAWGAS